MESKKKKKKKKKALSFDYNNLFHVATELFNRSKKPREYNSASKIMKEMLDHAYESFIEQPWGKEDVFWISSWGYTILKEDSYIEDGKVRVSFHSNSPFHGFVYASYGEDGLRIEDQLVTLEY